MRNPKYYSYRIDFLDETNNEVMDHKYIKTWRDIEFYMSRSSFALFLNNPSKIFREGKKGCMKVCRIPKKTIEVAGWEKVSYQNKRNFEHCRVTRVGDENEQSVHI